LPLFGVAAIQNSTVIPICFGSLNNSGYYFTEKAKTNSGSMAEIYRRKCIKVNSHGSGKIDTLCVGEIRKCAHGLAAENPPFGPSRRHDFTVLQVEARKNNVETSTEVRTRMKTALKLSKFQIGAPVKRGQGLRIGTARRPPRGVRKSRWTRDGYFDVWLPALAPSEKLRNRSKRHDFDDPAVRKAFFDRYEHELMSSAIGRQTVEFVARVAAQMAISIGCFCDDESRCHRSHLYKIIQRHG
jgi:uncharacterized protein YeaO (DUF488 family)